MAEFFLIPSIALLALILYQDLKYRAVSWLLFPVTCICLFILEHPWENWLQFSENLVFNLGFIFLNLGLLLLFFKIKKVTIKGMLNQFIGIGDILFFLILAIILPFPTFPIFFISSLILSLALALIAFRNKTTPLAGLQALFLAIHLSLDFLHINILPQNILTIV